VPVIYHGGLLPDSRGGIRPLEDNPSQHRLAERGYPARHRTETLSALSRESIHQKLYLYVVLDSRSSRFFAATNVT